MHFVLTEGFGLIFYELVQQLSAAIAALCFEMVSILKIRYLVLLDMICLNLPGQMLDINLKKIQFGFLSKF